MIVWLASYPRSGNTFLRIVLHRLYGAPTYSVYDDDDPVAQRLGPELVGYRQRPKDLRELADAAEMSFVKTHKRRKADDYAAIYLVRDGRDAIVSHARLRATQPTPSANGDNRGSFETLLREEINRPYIEGQPSSGSWGGNVLSWLNAGEAPLVLLKYENLVADPLKSVARAVSSLCPNLAPVQGPRIPSFTDLHAADSTFFRRGVVGSHRDELTGDLHELFWSRPENATAMQRLGYSR
jgi:hypothetical protein